MEDGEPAEATAGDAEIILSRLKALSQHRGVDFELKQTNRGYEVDIVQA
jgi:hypothetical protein